MSGSRLRPYLGPVVALLVVLALGAGTVSAAIPNGSGTYYACLTKSSGMVRLINYPTQKCATGERFIKWSQQGPAGLAGPAGAQGPQGVQGPKGDQGSVGPAGPADWNAIPNIPPGFADGVDNGDTTRSYVADASAWMLAGQSGHVHVAYPVGLDVKVTLVPWQDDVTFALIPYSSDQGEERFYRSGGTMHHFLYFRNVSSGSGQVAARVTVWNDSYIAPSAVKKMVKVTFHKGLKRPR